MTKTGHIIFIDDEPIQILVLKEIVKTKYSNVHSFCDGEEFFNYFNNNKIDIPDIVFTDINMPNMSGIDLILKAQENKDFNQTIFVAISSFFGEEYEKWLKSIGFYCLISKPIHKDKFNHFIDDSIRNKLDILKLINLNKNLISVHSEISNLIVKKSVLDSKYIKNLISPEVFNMIMNEKLAALKPKYTTACIGYVDIRGFTQLMNRIQIDQIDEILKIYFRFVSKCIRNNDGFLDKFIGDAVLWFHYDKEIDDLCKDCIQVGIDIIDGLSEINNLIVKKLHLKIKIQVGIGISSGTSAIGLFGGLDDRIQYSILGPPVNLAARLCSQARASEILIGGGVIEYCEHKTRKIGFIPIKGFDHDVEVRRILRKSRKL